MTVGLGISLRPGSPPPLRPSVVAAPAPVLVPDAQWDGSAGSGFATAPADPVRVSAKPACRLLQPDALRFTDTQLVGVMAMALNGDSMFDNLGLARVIFHYEGTRAEVLQPTVESFADANGRTVSYLGWWARLQHAGNGAAHLFVEAVPIDPAMQSRVIGPYTYYPAPSRYDVEVTVAPSAPKVPGSSFTSLRDAIDHVRGAAAPHIRFAEGGTYGWPTPRMGAFSPTSRITVSADAPVVLTRDTAANPNNPAWRPVVPLHLQGANITVDIADMEQVYTEAGQPEWVFDGCRVTDTSPRPSYYRRGLRSASSTIRRSPYHCESTLENIPYACSDASLVRGCTISGCYSDLFNRALCVVDPVVTSFSSEAHRIGHPALEVRRAGSGISSATLRASGFRTYILEEDGAELARKAFTPASSVQDVADWIGGFAGWSATVLDNRVSGRYLSLSGDVIPDQPFPAQDALGAGVTLWSRIDLHGDLYQLQQTAVENAIVWGVQATGAECQNLFLDGPQRDMFVVNCAIENLTGTSATAAYQSGMGTAYARSHVAIAHNTIPAQTFQCEGGGPEPWGDRIVIANNVFADLVWKNTPEANGTVRDNHLADGAIGTGDAGESRGGSIDDLILDAAGRDWRPAGALLSERAAPCLTFDLARRRRANPSAKGALA